MLRKLDVVTHSKKPLPKGMLRVPFTSRVLIKDGTEVEARMDVIMPPYGDRVRLKDRAAFDAVEGVGLEIGLEDLLQAIREYRKAKPRLFCKARVVEKEKVRRKPPMFLGKGPVPPKPIRLSIAPKKRKKPERIEVSPDASTAASLIRNTLRNRGTVRLEKIVTPRKESAIVPKQKEKPLPKMSLEEMGVEFGKVGDTTRAVAQRYEELQEYVVTRKSRGDEEEDG